MSRNESGKEQGPEPLGTREGDKIAIVKGSNVPD